MLKNYPYLVNISQKEEKVGYLDDIFGEKEEKRGKGGPNKKEDKKEDFLKSIFKKEEKGGKGGTVGGLKK